MILRADSLTLRVLRAIARRALWVEAARVGQNCTDYVRVSLHRN